MAAGVCAVIILYAAFSSPSDGLSQSASTVVAAPTKHLNPATEASPKAPGPTAFPNPPGYTFLPFTPPKQPKDGLKIAVFTILKREHNYVTNWVKYHLALSFDLIYLYDNEDEPTYADILRNEGLGADGLVIEVPYKAPMPKNWDEDRIRVIVKHSPDRVLPVGRGIQLVGLRSSLSVT